jgi:methionine aminotransferase
MELTSKLPQIGVTIFTTMSKLANEVGAINLSQGFPDFNPDERLLAAVNRAMAAGLNQYAPMHGLASLRHEIASKTQRGYGVSADVETDITVTSGATEAIFCAIMATVSPGDEVVVFEPAYDSYLPAILLAGGKPVFVRMHHPDYKIDWAEVGKRVGAKTKLIIINSPHNPTGATFSKADMVELSKLLDGTKTLLISDEVYEHLIFDGIRHESAHHYPVLRERAFIVSSFGKTFHVTGWKIGYCVAPPALTREFRKVHQYVTFCTTAPMQAALADYLKDPATYETLPAFYQKKRDLFGSLLTAVPLRLLPSHGTYFQLADYSAVSKAGDVDFAMHLTKEYGVAVVPTSPFYHDGFDPKVVRFCFAKKDETLRAAGERLAKLKA